MKFKTNFILKIIWFLWFFTCVSWGISPAQILLIVQTTAICHSIFISPLFLCLSNLEFQNLLLSVPSVPSCYFPPLCLFHPTLFYSSFYSLFCFLPLFIRFIFWSSLLFSFHICYPLFSLSYCSVLSASPLCTVPIQSVLFLLVVILLDLSI